MINAHSFTSTNRHDIDNADIETFKISEGTNGGNEYFDSNHNFDDCSERTEESYPKSGIEESDSILQDYSNNHGLYLPIQESNFYMNNLPDISSTSFSLDDNSDSDSCTINTYEESISQFTTEAITIDDDIFDVSTNKITCRDLIKEVRFGSVSIREYGVTIGANTASDDSCPLQLTWEYKSPDIFFPHLESYNYYKFETSTNEIIEKSSDFKRHSSPCRLSLDDRRHRIAKVQNISIQKVKKMELELIKDTLSTDDSYMQDNCDTFDEFQVLDYHM